MPFRFKELLELPLTAMHLGPSWFGMLEERTKPLFNSSATEGVNVNRRVWLQRQEGLQVALDDLNLKVVDRTKVLKYAVKYPIPVQQTVQLATWRSEPS